MQKRLEGKFERAVKWEAQLLAKARVRAGSMGQKCSVSSGLAIYLNFHSAIQN